MAPETDPPFQRIAADLRRRITAGELAPGDPVPSTRRLARDWGVALATATKALTVLRLEGLVEARPRIGTVVAGGPGPAAGPGAAGTTPDALEPSAAPGPAGPVAPPPAGAPGLPAGRPPAADGEPGRERLVRAALEIADAEGLPALSMRAVAARLGVSAMSPYRYVTGKEDLVLLMADAAFGEVGYPAVPPAGWRPRLEQSARVLWTLFRRHPWLAHVSPLTRPLLLPNLMVHAEWSLAALDGLGLDAHAMMDVHVLLYSYVEGIAANLERESQAQASTGIGEEEWMDHQLSRLTALAGSGRYPVFSRLMGELAPGYDLDLDALFEFGLANLLDGLTARLAAGTL